MEYKLSNDEKRIYHVTRLERIESNIWKKMTDAVVSIGSNFLAEIGLNDWSISSNTSFFLSGMSLPVLL